MKGWFPWAAGALAAALLGASLWPARPLRGALFVLTILCVVGAFINLLVERRQRRYDLDELRRVHELAEVHALDVPAVKEPGSVHCLCGEVYTMDLPVCPKCRRSQYG